MMSYPMDSMVTLHTQEERETTLNLPAVSSVHEIHHLLLFPYQ